MGSTGCTGTLQLTQFIAHSKICTCLQPSIRNFRHHQRSGWRPNPEGQDLKYKLNRRSHRQSTSSRTLVSASAQGDLKDSYDVVIIGAGVAGLACGLSLSRAGVDFAILEASDGVGGRVRTDVVDGFLLDRGFQIFLTSYQEAQSVLDYSALDLKPFYAGALVRWNGSFHRVADPFRHPADGVASLANPVGSPLDKALVGLLRLKALLKSPEEVLKAPETSTLERLQAEGFSEGIIDRFFRPFLGGIFFDRGLGTTSRLFEFVMRCLATGQNCLPAAGIGAVAAQLASRLPQGSILTGVRVESVAGSSGGQAGSVGLPRGRQVAARRAVVVATDAPAARSLLGTALDASPSKTEAGVGTCNLYFRAPRAPREENILYLNGESSGLVNNACFPSTVAPSYAPAGQALVSVSTIGMQPELSDAQLADTVKAELASWFAAGEVATWQLLRIYRIPFAQPNQSPPTDLERPVQLSEGLFVCGDHRESATLDGALKSGRRAAQAILAGSRAAVPSGAQPVAAQM